MKVLKTHNRSLEASNGCYSVRSPAGKLCSFSRNLGKASAFILVSALLVAFTAPFINEVFGSLPTVDVTVDASRVIGRNDLSLGFMLDAEWKSWRDTPIRRQLADAAGFNLIRVFDWKSSSPHPCTYWNDALATGTWNWADVDLLVQRIFEVGAEPIFALGCFNDGVFNAPRGMAINPTTRLPYISSWAAYCASWVQHFKATGRPVRFYEIVNEPQAYIGWSSPDWSKLPNYVQLWNAAARRMRAEKSGLYLGFDYSTRKNFLDYWVSHGDNLDFIGLHKYDAFEIEGYGSFSDSAILDRVETYRIDTSSLYYGIDEARQVWYRARGKMLPVIINESNLNSHVDPSDPRIQQMLGTVWTASLLRMAVLKGIEYYIRYCFTSYGRSANQGFGMVNATDNRPWYPYYVQKWIGTNLSPGDSLVSITSTSSDIRTLAWKHNGILNILLISQINLGRSIRIRGVSSRLTITKVDNAISWHSPDARPQTGTLDPGVSLNTRGYTVALLQTAASSSDFQDGFESGSFSKWSGTGISSGETAAVVNSRRYSGTYSARFTSNGGGGSEYSYCYKTISSAANLYARAYFYISQSGIVENDDRFYLITLRAGSNHIAYAGWRKTNGVVKWSLVIFSGTSAVMAYSSAAVSLNRWFNVELHWKKDATNGLGELWVNSTKVCSITAKNTSTYGSANSVRFGLYQLTNCGSTTAYCDSCVVDDARIG